jgi:hypothetical protein
LPHAHAQRAGAGQLPTTTEDFFAPGTQPEYIDQPLLLSLNCSGCHSFDDDGNEEQVIAPLNTWRTSMMAQSARDPIWHAAVAVANADANVAGEFCIRCHAPVAWLAGRSTTGDPTNFIADDFDGITCHHCHRMVDPVADIENPVEDDAILQELIDDNILPMHVGNSQYVVDPIDTRRGPLDDVPMNMHPADILISPYHEESLFCGTCHDVSVPTYTRQKDGSYALNAYDAAHPTGDPNDMVPEQRTYSEWLYSDFATTGVVFPDNRFGGDHPTGIIQSCQDCHMPVYNGGLCVFWENPPFFERPDVPQHGFNGANTWVLEAVRTVDLNRDGLADFPDETTGLNDTDVTAALDRTVDMLRDASDMELAQLGTQLKVRIINQTGHKLPTGYPEGRRMWINVKFLGELGEVVYEHGHYDNATAHLDEAETKVYESKFGVDKAVSKLTGVPVGESFHLVLNNTRLKDNRIPPRGFNNANFESVSAEPINYSYEDGDYWDDTMYTIPAGTEEAVVTLYYQSTSKEYIEFLRDSVGGFNDAGIAAYEAWLAHGMSAPVDMDSMSILLTTYAAADLNQDGFVNVTDLLDMLGVWGICPPPDICPADLNCDGRIDTVDLLALLSQWG